MPVGVLYDSGQTYNGRAYRDCIASAHAHAVPIVIARRGMHWSSGDGVMLDVLAPSLPFLAATGDDVNENSIVAMLHYRGFRELFMGDAGEASEARLLASGDDLHADALKVGHHGSRYASTAAFATAVHPRFAVISVGRHNTFGHPAPATLRAWNRVDGEVLRTDMCGAIVMSSQSVVTMLRCAAH
jgi:beta-lactamase superfamily II metal-dependent hydrolase